MSSRTMRTTLSVILLLVTTPASSFERLGVTWINGLVSFRVNPNFPVDPDFDGTLAEARDLQTEILRCSASNWRDQTSGDFRFNYLGRSTRRGFNLDDGVNNVSWLDEDGGTALAVTVIEGFGSTATDFDITFFESTNNRTSTWNVGQDPDPGQMDILGIGVHEFGHALGLAHSSVRQATMFAAALDRGRSARSLHADDVTGVETLYGIRDDSDPSITVVSVSPQFGPVSGGNSVIVNGRNFTWTANSTLRIDNVILDRSRYDVLDCGRIHIHEMPAGSREEDVNIRVNNQFGSSTLEDAYRYGAPLPIVLSISPDHGPVTGGIEITVHGEFFEEGARVAVGGNIVSDAVIVDSETIVGTLPAGSSGGSVSVILQQGEEQSTLANGFTYDSNVLRIEDATGPASARDLPVRVLASHDDRLSGLSFAFVYDGNDVTVNDVTVDDSAAAAAEFSAANISNENGVTTYGVVMSFINDVPSIPPAVEQHVATIFTSLSEDLQEGDQVPLTLEDLAGAPPIELQFVPVDGGINVIHPFAVSGAITINDGFHFIRGDNDLSSVLDISDAVSLLDALFQGIPGRNCQDAGDANDDRALDISDGIFILLFLFGGGETPAEPYPEPGTDPTPDDLICMEGLN